MVVGTDAHSSIVNTLRLLEMDALVVDTPDHRLTAETRPRGDRRPIRDLSDVAAVVCTSGTTNAGIIDDLAGVGALAQGARLVVPRRRRLRRVGHLRPLAAAEVRRASSRPTRSSSTRTSGCSPRSTAARCCTASPSWPAPRTPRTRRTSTSSTPSDGEWNPTDYAYHLTRRARGLPLWFSLAVYGRRRLPRGHRGRGRRWPVETAELIKAAPQLELIREPDLGVVLFRRLGWKPEDYDAWAQRAARRTRSRSSRRRKWEGETVGRFAFLHPHTTMDLVRGRSWTAPPDSS